MKLKAIPAIAAAVSVLLAMRPAQTAHAGWDWYNIGCMGDLNGDGKLTGEDLDILSDHLLGRKQLTDSNSYRTNGSYIGINGADGFQSGDYFVTADMNRDGVIDTFDLVIMRREMADNVTETVWKWQQTYTDKPPLEPPPETARAPIYDLYGSMPPQNDAKLLVFYVDFPDCRYSFSPSEEQIEKAVFGKGDPADENYPFESIRGFLKRSSKGAMKLSGRAYRYTTQHEKSYYEGDRWHIEFIDEIISSFRNRMDFSGYDGNGDDVVDSILISVPKAAGAKNWWPAAGEYGGAKTMIDDRMSLGHIIVGNAEISSETDHYNFVSSYIHELGHCMGLPDYYLYVSEGSEEDFEGLHGSAGFEMMDDANCDFGALSKLMLGWYKEYQICNIYPYDEPQTYGLMEAQTESGNCIILFNDNYDDENYRCEFFIMELVGLRSNNKNLPKDAWWRSTGRGVRIFHVSAEVDDSTGVYTWRYSSGNDEYTDNDRGRRFIRLVNDTGEDSDNLFRSGAVIDSSVPGFRWYDEYGRETVDTGIEIIIGDIEDGVCYLDIKRNSH